MGQIGELIGSLVVYGLFGLIVWKTIKSSARKWVKIVVSVVFALLIIGRVGSISNTQADVNPVQTAAQTKSKYEVGPPDAQEMLELVNAERAKVSVAPLAMDSRLSAGAQYKADDMVARNYFSHYDPSNPKLANGVQYAYNLTRQDDGISSCTSISENIYTGTGVAWSSINALRGWMESKPHREAMLDARYTTTGFGVSGDKVVEHFCQSRE